MDGKATAESCGAVFKNPNHATSAHDGIGYNGEICQYVDEKDTAWVLLAHSCACNYAV